MTRERCVTTREREGGREREGEATRVERKANERERKGGRRRIERKSE